MPHNWHDADCAKRTECRPNLIRVVGSSQVHMCLAHSHIYTRYAITECHTMAQHPLCLVVLFSLQQEGTFMAKLMLKGHAK